MILQLVVRKHLERVKKYLINAVEAREKDLNVLTDILYFRQTIESIKIRVALFNELHVNASSAYSKVIVKQYEDEIALYIKESHDMLSDKQISGYIAAIISENRASETEHYYPKESKFEYYYHAEPNGRSFKIIGETFAG